MKSMKKLVLVGLVLLTSVMILVGCQMEAEVKVPKVYEFTTEPQILTNYESPNGTGDEYIYVAFGDWPQTIKASDVTVDESKSKQMGMFTYYLGSDGNYYVKHMSKYYKVEPIVWRVLNSKDKEYDELESPLLLAENILIGGIPYYSVYNVKRTIGGVEIFTNNYEHSQIRAFLNGLSYEYKESDSAEQIKKDEYKDAGFLQTAFIPDVHNLIANTIVDNSARSTTDAEQKLPQATKYACGYTKDKIFLLSEQEATTEGYGFAKYNEYVGDSKGTTISTRIRVTTDYAKATGADQDGTTGSGGLWRLRSPFYYDECSALYIDDDGKDFSRNLVTTAEVGVVPALSISLQ